jgi:hypothetical protein
MDKAIIGRTKEMDTLQEALRSDEAEILGLIDTMDALFEVV